MVDEQEKLEDIREISKRGWTKGLSPIDKWLAEGYFAKRDLIFAYEDVSTCEGGRVTASFQLPCRFRLPNFRWLKVRSEFGHPYLAVSTVGRMNGRERTQVFISFQLWYRRREVYESYLDGIESGLDRIKTDAKSKGFWKLDEYEADVAHRLHLQSLEILKEFIPLYRVVANQPGASIPMALEKFFIMMRNGRVIRKLQEDGQEPLPQHRSRVERKETLNKRFNNLERRIKNNVPPSIYEMNFLEVQRLIDRGNYDLAIVQTIVILDWFANEIIESHLITRMKKCLSDESDLYNLIHGQVWETGTADDSKIKVNTTTKYQKYFPLIGIPLTNQFLSKFKKTNRIRNEIVHRYKPSQITHKVATEGLDCGRAIVQSTMEKLLTQKR